MKKHLDIMMSICLALLLTVSVLSNVAHADEEGLSKWARPIVEKSIEKGRVPIDLRPFNRAITRREFCYVLNNFALDRIGTTYENLEKIMNFKTDDIEFEDTNDFQVRFSAGLGLVRGVSDTHFKPDKTLTRQEAATIVARLYILLNNQPQGAEEGAAPHPYLDRAKIADWAIKSVDFMSNSGVIKGYSSGNFGPLDPYTIEQAIVTVSRAAFGD